MALLRYEELTYKIIGCAMAVHKELGNGFQEVIYQRCLALEFERNSILFEREREMPIFYHGIQVGTRRADFLVEYKVIVESKAVIQLDEADLAQALNYLEAFDLPTGLLINFGATSLQFKRLLNKKYGSKM
ncbi:MAG TPA: GxxExxY protein [Cyclobacteriaceae bacterium]|nr:GxxExxY protein [Cyclobacteriaceae bacterium]